MRPTLTCAVLALLLLPATARAEFEAPELVSGNSEIPAEGADSPAISHDGRYLVFQGKIAGDRGVFRRDLHTGALEPVAAGVNEAVNPEPAPNAPDAAAPSVSADGRYVAFTSTHELDPEAEMPEVDKGCPQVYVRDMDLKPGEPGAYVLASAVGGEAVGEKIKAIEFRGGCPSPEEAPTQVEPAFFVAGAQSAAGVALSADGRRVVFTVLSPSGLVPGGTEGGQVVVRDLTTHETKLVSEAFNGADEPTGEAPKGGGGYPSTTAEPPSSLPLGSEPLFGVQPTASSAAISGDGSTIAWLGTDVPQQVPSATDVTAHMASHGGEAKEVEPLWRQIYTSEGAPASKPVTKRLLGEAGLNLYFEKSHVEENVGVNGGTLFAQIRSQPFFVPPALDENGETVVTIANQPTSTNEATYGFGGHQIIPPADLYEIKVNGKAGSQPQVTPLTATPSFNAARASASGVANVAISPDGSRVAFNTRRTSFSLSPPSLISPPAPEGESGYTYEINLNLHTMQRVTSTLDGSTPNGQPHAIAISPEAQTVAFATNANNLIANPPTLPEFSQVYVTHELPGPTEVAGQTVSEAPLIPLPTAEWVLSATAATEASGVVIVNAEVPGAGNLGADLVAQLPLASVGHSAAHASHAGHASKKSRSRKRKRAARAQRVPTAVAPVTVGHATTVAGGPGGVQLSLRVDTRYWALTYAPYGLYCLVRVTFTAPGEPSLSQVIPVIVRSPAPPAPPKRRARKASAHRSVHKRPSGMSG